MQVTGGRRQAVPVRERPAAGQFQDRAPLVSVLAWFWHAYIGQWILAGITVGVFVLSWAAIENRAR